jgi:hypothetical protein
MPYFVVSKNISSNDCLPCLYKAGMDEEYFWDSLLQVY